MLSQGINVAPILCHECQQPVYLSPPSSLTYVEFAKHVKLYWQARHVDDTPICQTEVTSC